MRWKVILAGAVLGLGILAAQKYVARTLTAERALTVSAIRAANEAIEYADSVEAAAQAHVARVDTLIVYRRAAQPQRDSVVAAAPDTCAPAIAALKAELADADSIASGWKSAFEDEQRAAARLRVGTATVTEAADKLVKASGGFWKDIIPEVGFGVAAGIDPTEADFDTVIGITLSWDY